MASRYFKLAFSTIGALGFGLVTAAVFLPQTFSGLFNPEAVKSAPTSAEREALRAATANVQPSTVTIDLPQTKDALDIMAEGLKTGQDQQAAEIAAIVQTIQAEKAALAGTPAPAPAETPAEPAPVEPAE